MISAGTVIEGSFRLLRERPMAVAVWGLIYLALQIATTFTIGPMLDPSAMAAGLSPMVGMFLLVQLLGVIIFIVLMTAAQRAILRPRDEGLAFLAFGMDEVRMIALTIILSVIFYVGLILIALLFAAIIGGAAMAGSGAGTVVMGFIFFVALFGLIVWFMVRLSLAMPLTLLRRKIIIGESWRLTKGHFWSLFGGYLVVFLLLIAISIALAAVTSGSYLSAMMQSMSDPAAAEAAMQEQLEAMQSLTPMTILGWVLGGVSGALTVALGGGAVATAARELTGDREAMAETFA